MNNKNRLADDSCLEQVNEATLAEVGIVQVDLDIDNASLAIDYDAQQVSATQVQDLMQRISPAVAERWRTCTLRLGEQGGRACESCARALENRLRQTPGVRRAAASYRGGVLSITYDERQTTSDDIVRQVVELGVPLVPAPEVGGETAVSPSSSPFASLKKWLELPHLAAIFAAITLLAMVVGYVVERLVGVSWITAVLYTIAYIAGGTFGLKAGLESLRARTIDVDLLMILAAIGAAIVGEPFEGAMLLFLFSLSNVLQTYALGRTRRAIESLITLRPSQALVRRGEETMLLPIEQIRVGDQIIVKPGERIALDGKVVAGESSVDQASLTGESMPVGKRAGDMVFAGTINKHGSLEIGVTKLAEDTTLARLIKLVEEAHSEKAQTQRFIDRFEQVYATAVIIFTFLAAVVPLLWQEPFSIAFYRAMTIMVAASPCALVISTPATVLSAIGNGARRGVLFKGGVYVENAATIKAVAFDKTGTLTVGEPQLIDIVPLAAIDETELLRLATAVEAKSEHPLAQAVVRAAQERQLMPPAMTAFQAIPGQGVQGLVENQLIRVGNVRYFAGLDAKGLGEGTAVVKRLQQAGKTSVLVGQQAADGTVAVLGVMAFADVLRDDAPDMVQALRQHGIEHIVMLTGDNQAVGEQIGAEAGVDEVYAELLPEDKVQVLRQLQQAYGAVAMVGDGVNDAPALATATIGIAMGAAGTDVALETADIVLMSNELKNIPYVIGLSRQTRRTLIANLGFSLFMIALMLVVIFTASLPLPLAVLGHEGGTVLVSLNGLRMLAYRGGAE